MSSHVVCRDRVLVALATVSLLAAMAPSPIVAMPHFDGVWYVSIVTKKGECESGQRYPVRITGGALSNASDMGLVISGRVSEGGQVTVVVKNGSTSAAGSGRLSSRSGNGNWRGDSCSGTWSAERRHNGRIAPLQ